ncbi:hypothetical protein EVA_01282 [gut metagenome]|uniref:Uncharacterized protein n=1 Tax=gut metagenome TaxID=749906 RepID=J9GQ40_9ZZZZ
MSQISPLLKNEKNIFPLFRLATLTGRKQVEEISFYTTFNSSFSE